jgi:hypothetical protein
MPLRSFVVMRGAADKTALKRLETRGKEKHTQNTVSTTCKGGGFLQPSSGIPHIHKRVNN